MTDEAFYSVSAPQIAAMMTRDGARLDADIYRPDSEKAFPVLLMRQPYGRRLASTVAYAHPRWYAARGYVVVIQDVRGRGSSSGDFEPFANELEDGWDTLDWLSDLPGTTGEVGMYGFSYQGVTQFLAAASGHTALKAIAPAMAGFDIRRDMAWEGGVFCVQRNVSWAAQLTAETARKAGDEARYRDLHALGHGPSQTDLLCPGNEQLRERLAGSHFSDWLDTPKDGPFWRDRSPHALMQGIEVPAFYIGGWSDGFLSGTLRAFAAHGEAPCRLVIGPWAHLPWQRHVGEWDMGAAAHPSALDQWQLQWFDAHLKGHDNGILDQAPVQLYDITTKQWRGLPHWPGAQGERLYLHGEPREQAGRLQSEPGSGQVVLVHDPWRPAPDLGSHASPTAGPRAREVIDQRPDVLSFDSAPFERDSLLAGDVHAWLEADSDVSSFDLHVYLSLVEPSGMCHNIASGVQRIASDEQPPYQISLRGICVTVAAQHVLRLSCAAAAFPAYELNPGTGTPSGRVRACEHLIQTVRLKMGENSYLALAWAHAEN